MKTQSTSPMATPETMREAKADKITNLIMDYLRVKLNINPDSDLDDEVYGAIHNKVKWEY